MTEARGIRLALMSDLHNEMEPPPRPTVKWRAMDGIRESIPGHPGVGPVLDSLFGENIDLVILAGDIDLGVNGVRYAERVAMFLRVRVVYVMGNHEPYCGRDLDLLVQEIRAAAMATDGKVTFLENERAVFDFNGQRLHVMGCTLWTDYEVNGSEPDDVSWAMQCAHNGLNDHRRIFLHGRILTPQLARNMHMESRAWLSREFENIRSQEGQSAKVIVVTHHAPITEANGPQFIGGKLSPAFASDLTREIAAWRPSAWTFGHTHHSFDAMVGETRVVSAQRGYVCYESGAEEFVPLVIEL